MQNKHGFYFNKTLAMKIKLFLLAILALALSAEAQWKKAENVPPYTEVQAFATDGETIFCGNANGKVIVPPDKGASWKDMAVTFSDGFPISSMMAAEGIVLAASYNKGLFMSADKGVSWKQ